MNRRPRAPWRASGALALAIFALSACSDQLPFETSGDAALAPSAGARADLSGIPDDQIRIGVVPEASSIAFGSAAEWTLRDRSGATLLQGTGGTVTMTARGPQAWYRLQVQCGSVAAADATEAAARAKGHTHFFREIHPTLGCTRLFIGRFAPPPANTFTARTSYKNQLVAEGLAPSDAFWVVKAELGAVVYTATRGSTVVESGTPISLHSSDGLVTIAGVRYRGIAEAHVNAAGKLAGINQLPLEEYLYGVVPRELPPSPYGELEAQKAQAVAARTYAYVGLGKRASEGYDLLPTTTDQVYGGYDAEEPVSSAAVDATAGVVATYEGEPIDALFSSTSGGHTADSEEVYANAIPYLRGVPDAQRGEAFEHVPTLEVFRSHANARSLRNLKGGDFEADWSRYHRWTFEWSNQEISDVVSAYFQQPVGKVLEINVLSRGPSGRVLEIEFVTEAGTFTERKDRIRTALKFINASGTMSSLLSTLFFIEPVTDPRTKALDGFKAYGGGWGHGVGLSQTGAVGMAEKGATYEEILKHYFRGIEVETRLPER